MSWTLSVFYLALIFLVEPQVSASDLAKVCRLPAPIAISQVSRSGLFPKGRLGALELSKADYSIVEVGFFNDDNSVVGRVEDSEGRSLGIFLPYVFFEGRKEHSVPTDDLLRKLRTGSCDLSRSNRLQELLAQQTNRGTLHDRSLLCRPTLATTVDLSAAQKEKLGFASRPGPIHLKGKLVAAEETDLRRISGKPETSAGRLMLEDDEGSRVVVNYNDLPQELRSASAQEFQCSGQPQQPAEALQKKTGTAKDQPKKGSGQR